jgi:hypothetical protein
MILRLQACSIQRLRLVHKPIEKQSEAAVEVLVNRLSSTLHVRPSTTSRRAWIDRATKEPKWIVSSKERSFS